MSTKILAEIQFLIHDGRIAAAAETDRGWFEITMPAGTRITFEETADGLRREGHTFSTVAELLDAEAALAAAGSVKARIMIAIGEADPTEVATVDLHAASGTDAAPSIATALADALHSAATELRGA